MEMAVLLLMFLVGVNLQQNAVAVSAASTHISDQVLTGIAILPFPIKDEFATLVPGSFQRIAKRGLVGRFGNFHFDILDQF
jgi:hypothetical protein